MVIGSGMMAKAFSEFSDDDSVIVFASGVSNSKETDELAYQREMLMLSELKGTTSTLIYFSSCSIFDSSLKSSMYVEHKKNIEKYIELNFNNYWIFRLPNVIGDSNNPNTMINFFHHALSNNHTFELNKQAVRYFIDVEDVHSIIKQIISCKSLASGCYNLLFPSSYSVLKVVYAFEDYLGKKGNYLINDKEGAYYQVNISEQLLPYIKFDMNDPEAYLKKTFKKYYAN